MQKVPLVLSILLAVIAWSTVRAYSPEHGDGPATSSQWTLEQALNAYLGGSPFTSVSDDRDRAGRRHVGPATRTTRQPSDPSS